MSEEEIPTNEATEYKSRREEKKAGAARRMKRQQTIRNARKWVVVAVIAVVALFFLYKELKADEPLPVATLTSTTPINKLDFFHRKPLGEGSGSMVYKGYKIGFCCNESMNRWQALSDRERDNLVRPLIP